MASLDLKEGGLTLYKHYLTTISLLVSLDLKEGGSTLYKHYLTTMSLLVSLDLKEGGSTQYYKVYITQCIVYTTCIIEKYNVLGKPVTTRSNAIIRQAVLRDKWNLLHRDIRLKQFLGQG